MGKTDQFPCGAKPVTPLERKGRHPATRFGVADELA
jgi:hypothetical protein